VPLPGYQYRHNDRFRGEFLSTMCIPVTSTDWRLRR